MCIVEVRAGDHCGILCRGLKVDNVKRGKHFAPILSFVLLTMIHRIQLKECGWDTWEQ